MNKYYAIAYKLTTIKDGVKKMEEEATAEDPFVFISGFGTTIPGFEKEIEKLANGDSFDFTIPCAEAYGEYVDARVITLAKDIFTVNGVFDANMIYVGAIIPLQNEDGMRFMGKVLSVDDKNVKVDLNHPLAGCDLNFAGAVAECREATNEEITQMINRLSGGGCHGCGGGGCHSDDGGCNGDGCGNCGDGGCGGEGCGNCK